MRFKNSTVVNQANLVEPYSGHVLLSSDFQHRFHSLFLTLWTTTVRNRGGFMWPPGPGAGQALPVVYLALVWHSTEVGAQNGSERSFGCSLWRWLQFPSQPATSSEEKELLHQVLPRSSHTAAHSIPALLLHLSPSHFSDSFSSHSGSDGLLRAAGARALTGFARFPRTEPVPRTPPRTARSPPPAAVPTRRGRASRAAPDGRRDKVRRARREAPAPRKAAGDDPGAGPRDAARRRSRLRARPRAVAGASRDAELNPRGCGPFFSASAADRAERPGHLHGGRRSAPLRALPPPAALPGPRPGAG